MRLVGRGAGARMENRLPGADVNPYLALAAMLAGGLHGIEQELELEEELVGNAYTSDSPRVPTTLRAAREASPPRAWPATAFGDEVVEHYLNMADVELRRVRGRRHRLGAAPRLREDVSRRRPRSPVVNPATARPLGEVHLATEAETDAAIEAAHEAFLGWRAIAPGERARLLRRFADVVDAHVEELAELEVRNSGHTWGNARWEAGNVRDCLHYYAGAPERLLGRQIPVAGGVDLTFHEPLGVVGIIVPWNFPMPIAGVGLRPRAGRAATRWSSSPPS